MMIPALWAVFLAARGMPPLPLVGVIVLGTLATSATGCVVNDLWDRDIDPQVTTIRQSRHRRCNGSVDHFRVSRPLPQPALVLVVRGSGASDCVVSSSETSVSSTPTSTFNCLGRGGVD